MSNFECVAACGMTLADVAFSSVRSSASLKRRVDQITSSDPAAPFSSGPIQQPLPIDADDLCSVCRKAEAIYTCPRCQCQTCSLSCVRAHKSTAPCDGMLLHAAYLPVNQMTDETLNADVTFLEAASRYVGHSQRHPLLINRLITKRHRHNTQTDVDILPVPTTLIAPRFITFQRECLRRNINALLMPNGMSKHKKNTSRYDQKKKRIVFKIECLFVGDHRTDSAASSSSSCGATQKTSSVTDYKLVLDNVSGDCTWKCILMQIIAPNQWAQLIQGDAQLVKEQRMDADMMIQPHQQPKVSDDNGDDEDAPMEVSSTRSDLSDKLTLSAPAPAAVPKTTSTTKDSADMTHSLCRCDHSSLYSQLLRTSTPSIRHHLQQFASAIDDVHCFMQIPLRSARTQRFYSIDVNTSITQALQGKTFIENPTFYFTCNDQQQLRFPLLTQHDIEQERQRKTGRDDEKDALADPLAVTLYSHQERPAHVEHKTAVSTFQPKDPLEMNIAVDSHTSTPPTPHSASTIHPDRHQQIHFDRQQSSSGHMTDAKSVTISAPATSNPPASARFKRWD